MRKEINILKDVIRKPFAWPGGYEKILLMNDGGIICHKCAKEEFRNILHSTKYKYQDRWQVFGVTLNDIFENGETCSHCNTWLDAYNEENESNNGT